jgi:plasmid maintenance system antidote protein VapI
LSKAAQLRSRPCPSTFILNYFKDKIVLHPEFFDEHERSQNWLGGLAQLLGMPETRLREILCGKRSMNLDFARRLHQRPGISAEVVLTLRDAAYGRSRAEKWRSPLREREAANCVLIR